jgi:hypothetical protein
MDEAKVIFANVATMESDMIFQNFLQEEVT